MTARKPLETEGRKPLPIPAADMLAALLDRSDLLVVDGRPFLLVRVSPPMLDRLAEFGAAQAEAEADDWPEQDDEPEDEHDAEPTPEDAYLPDEPPLPIVQVDRSPAPEGRQPTAAIRAGRAAAGTSSRSAGAEG